MPDEKPVQKPAKTPKPSTGPAKVILPKPMQPKISRPVPSDEGGIAYKSRDKKHEEMDKSSNK